MNKTDRLLITCDFAPISGGQSAYYTNLWSNLDPQKNFLLLPGCCKPMVKTPSAAFFNFPFGEKAFARIVRTILVVGTLFRYAITLHPREIHAGQLVSGGMAALLIKKLLGIDYVLYIHGSDILEFSRTVLQRALVRAILAGSIRVVANSNFTKDKIADICPEACVTIVAPGVEARFFLDDQVQTASLRDQLALNGKIVMLTVGRLIKRKGHDTVIKAMSHVIKKNPGIRYLIVGEGPCKKELRRLSISLGVDHYITWCGMVENEMLPSYYRLADFFIMVSRYIKNKGDAEGYGIVYLEANAAGLPVIGGREGGSMDAIVENETGLIVDNSTDPQEVAEAILKLASNPELRKELGAKGRAWAEKAVWEIRRKLWMETNRWPQ